MAPPKAGDFERQVEFMRSTWGGPVRPYTGVRRFTPDMDTHLGQLLHDAALDFGRIVMEFQVALLAALCVETGKIWTFTSASPPYRATIVDAPLSIVPLSWEYVEELALRYFVASGDPATKSEIVVEHVGTAIVVRYAQRRDGF